MNIPLLLELNMIPLEDNVGDIIGKAQRGLGISDSKLAEKANVSSETIRKLREGDVDEAALMNVAPILGLNAQALRELAKGEWHPKKIETRDGLAHLAQKCFFEVQDSIIRTRTPTARKPPVRPVTGGSSSAGIHELRGSDDDPPAGWS